MIAHEMTFNAFIDKAQAIAWVKENIEPDEEAECLTELRYCFYTGIAPRRSTIERMLREAPHEWYESHDL
jgi:hypothetical protein